MSGLMKQSVIFYTNARVQLRMNIRNGGMTYAAIIHGELYKKYGFEFNEKYYEKVI